MPGTFRIGAFDGTEKTMRDVMEGIIYRKTAIPDDLIKMRVTQSAARKDSFKAQGTFTREVRNNPKFAPTMN